MKHFFISICCIFIFFNHSVQAAIVNNNGDNGTVEKSEKVNAKCHVVLVDGSEAIIFYRIKSKKFHKLTDKIVGKKVLTQKSTKKIKVYRAHECVLEQDAFTRSDSQSLDKRTER